VVRKEGRVGEMDRDRQAFILRDTGGADVRCFFGSDDYADVFDGFESQATIASSVSSARADCTWLLAGSSSFQAACK
jgi:hypothetical protein